MNIIEKIKQAFSPSMYREVRADELQKSKNAMARYKANLEKMAEGIINDEICHCSCHKPGSQMMHITACCVTCERCESRIKTDKYEQHLEHCRGKSNKAL